MFDLLFAGIFQAVPDAFESVWNFFAAGKLFMLFLLALSLLSISVIIYKAIDLRRRQVLPIETVAAVEAATPPLGQEELRHLTGRLRVSESALGRLGLLALSGEFADKEEASRAVEAKAREEVVELESGVALLEVVITIAPLLGLLGTVSGLVNVFSNLGESADHSAIAMGIAEALNTTIAGLAIAVPTVIAHSFFMKKIEKMGVRLEVLLGGLLAAVYRPVVAPAASAAVDEATPIPAPPEPEVAAPAPLPDPGQVPQPPHPQPAAAPEPELVPQPQAFHPAPTPAEIAPPAEEPGAPPVTQPDATATIGEARPRLLAGQQAEVLGEAVPPAPEGSQSPAPDSEQPI